MALVGSSNFTGPGLTNNIELNVQIQREVKDLQDWFERHWEDAEDLTPEILKVCYSLPALDVTRDRADEDFGTDAWTEDAGRTQWYYYDLEREDILSDAAEIVKLICSAPETPRHRSVEDKTLADIRRKIEKDIKNSYFKSVQAPVGVKATLKAWMELS